MPKAISKRDMLRLHVDNHHRGLQYTLPSMDYRAMPEGSYAVVAQHVLVGDLIIRCMVMVPNWQPSGIMRKIDFAVKDFNGLPEVEEVLANMQAED